MSSASLTEHVTLKIKEKVWSGEFIEFSSPLDIDEDESFSLNLQQLGWGSLCVACGDLPPPGLNPRFNLFVNIQLSCTKHCI